MLDGGTSMSTDPDKEPPGGVDPDVKPQPLPQSKHRACTSPLPDVLPSAPPQGSQTDELYSGFRALECPAKEEVTLCDAETLTCNTGVSNAYCVQLDPAQPGFCTDESPRAVGKGAWVYSAKARCGRSLTPEQKQMACCTGAIDCTPDRKKGPGEDCLEHADCETGLLCKSAGWPYGLCTCPDVNPASIVADDCTELHAVEGWGTPAKARDLYGCAETDSGFSEETIAIADIRHVVVAAHGADLHVLYTDEDTVTHLSGKRGAWQAEPFFDEVRANQLAMAIDASGGIHAAACESAATVVIGPGTLPEKLDEGCLGVDLALNPQGAPSVAYYKFQAGVKLSRFVNGKWETPTVVDQNAMLPPPAPRIAIDAEDRVHLLYNIETDSLDGSRYRSIAESELTTDFLSTSWYDLTDTAVAPPVLTFSDSDYAVHLQTLDGRPFAPELIWRVEDPRFAYEATFPSVSFDSKGKPAIVHTRPDGLGYLRQVGKRFVSVPISPHVPGPFTQNWFELVFDGSDEPHVFYAVENDNYETELRHVFKGTCDP